MRFFPLSIPLCALIVAAGVAASVQIVQAATLRVTADREAYRPGDTVHARLLLDTEGESVNAVEARVIFPEGMFELSGQSDGNSVVSLWVDRPSATQGNTMHVSGIMPGGIIDTDAHILTLLLRAIHEGDATVSLDGVRVLLNDGAGTDAPVRTQNAAIRIRTDAPVPVDSTRPDREPPNPFTPMVERDPAIAENRYVVLFATQDKNSGMDYYDVFEASRPLTRPEDVRWERTESPYILRDQERRSYVYIRAVDQSGNTRIERIEPAHMRTPAWYETPWIIAILCTFVPLMLLAILGIRRALNHPHGTQKRGART